MKSDNRHRYFNVRSNSPAQLDWLQRDRSATLLSRNLGEVERPFVVIGAITKVERASNNVDANSEDANSIATWIAGDRRPVVFGAALHEVYNSGLSREEIRQLRLTSGRVAATLKQKLQTLER